MDLAQMQITEWFDGSSVPEVNSADIDAVLELCGGVQPTPDDRNRATGSDLMEQVCTPGADVRAVSYRAAMLQMLCSLNLLSQWLHDGVLDDAVINLAAKFPMERMQGGVVRNSLTFDFEEFVKQVKAETKKLR